MKQIFTSYFAVIRKFSNEMKPIGISVGRNKHLPGLPYEQRLAPTWPMLKMSNEDYDRKFFEHLSKLDAQAIYDSLPNNAVLLCYEKWNDRCHRRAVAEWFESELGIVVPEYGLSRNDSFPYSDLGKETKGVKYTEYKSIQKMEQAEKQKNLDENGDYIPESVRLRQESYKKENEPSLFDFL